MGHGGCSCGAGDYDVTGVANFENAITSVEVAESQTGAYGNTTYSIFVYAAGVPNGKAVATIEGDGGSGYYRSGFHLTVSEIGGDE